MSVVIPKILFSAPPSVHVSTHLLQFIFFSCWRVFPCVIRLSFVLLLSGLPWSPSVYVFDYMVIWWYVNNILFQGHRWTSLSAFVHCARLRPLSAPAAPVYHCLPIPFESWTFEHSSPAKKFIHPLISCDLLTLVPTIWKPVPVTSFSVAVHIHDRPVGVYTGRLDDDAQQSEAQK